MTTLPIDDRITLTKAIAEKILLSCDTYISTENLHALRDSTFDIIHQGAYGSILRMKTMLLGRKFAQHCGVISYPTNWWEAVKDRFFPTWLLHHYPVKWIDKQTTHTYYNICPHIAASDYEGRQVHFTFLGSAGETHD